MHRFAFVAVVLTLVAGCDRGAGTPTSPTAAPAPPPLPPAPVASIVRQVSIGDEVKDTFAGTALGYEFIAPNDGRVIARMEYDVAANGSILALRLGPTEFQAQPPNWSPVVGQWNVAGGQTYRLIVYGVGTDWWYNDTFALQTSIE